MLRKYFISQGASKKQAVIDIMSCVIVTCISIIGFVFFFLEYPYLFGFSGLNFSYLDALTLKVIASCGIFFLYLFSNLFFRAYVLKQKKVSLTINILSSATLCLVIEAYFVFEFLSEFKK